MADKIKKLARELQRIGQGSVTYSTCKRLLIARGFEEAKSQIETWMRESDAEIVRAEAGRP